VLVHAHLSSAVFDVLHAHLISSVVFDVLHAHLISSVVFDVLHAHLISSVVFDVLHARLSSVPFHVFFFLLKGFSFLAGVGTSVAAGSLPLFLAVSPRFLCFPD
jgi:hypothetical protein